MAKYLGGQRLSAYLGNQYIDWLFDKKAVTLVFSASTKPVGFGLAYDISNPTEKVPYVDIVPYSDAANNYTKTITITEGYTFTLVRNELAYPGCGSGTGGSLRVTFETPTPILYFGMNLYNNSYSGTVTCTVYIDDEYDRIITKTVPRTQASLVQNFAWYVMSSNDIFDV